MLFSGPIRNSLLASLCLGAGLLSIGCGKPEPTTEELRSDLVLYTTYDEIDNGLSGQIEVEVPSGVESMLIEVQGSVGSFTLTEFVTPSGRDVKDNATFVTRGARGAPGLVDWLYPNSDRLSVEPGVYKFRVQAKRGESLVGSEDLTIRVYMSNQKVPETCEIQLDFLVSRDSLTEDAYDRGLDEILVGVNNRLQNAGIRLGMTTSTYVDMQSADIDLGNASNAVEIVDELLEREKNRTVNGITAARDGALHVVFVRSIGGETEDEDKRSFDPAGYSMGIPGPYSVHRRTSAVLIATDKYVDFNGYLKPDELASSLAHEIGHYLGLFHTSERGGVDHDPLGDTPECEDSFSCSQSFLQNIMTSAFWSSNPAGRVNFTNEQARVMRGHPLCIPAAFTIDPPFECNLPCAAPETCALMGGNEQCLPACDPNDQNPCEFGSCEVDDAGTYVCQ